MTTQPNSGFSSAVKVAFHIARYRIIQRGVMVWFVSFNVASIIFGYLFTYLPMYIIYYKSVFMASTQK